MSDIKYEQFIERLLIELPELAKEQDLYNVFSNLKDQFHEILKANGEDFLDISTLTAREWLLFTFGQLCWTGIKKEEREEALFNATNNIRRRKGLPVELSKEEIEQIELERQGDDEYYSELYKEEKERFARFLNSGYNDDLDPDQQNESFW